MFIATVASLPVTLERRKEGGSKSYHGTGTWFVPVNEGGPYGSCGPKEDSNSLIAALNHEQYGEMNRKSPWCGKKIKVEGEKGAVVVTINDACPGCGFGDLDLTPKVFKEVIGDMNKGVGPITWYAV
ncbi:RlpA-like double-psi beta-barrel-protein domain-containing protein-containing protein [Dichotomocladium elegans]|nr:RlpA-like double-psi beta-barrel-protein domain-containing protein-containing protein [Dichotomocladium elegans]